MHVLEYFSDGCALCDQHLEQIRGAKCADCDIVVYDASHRDWKEKVRAYGVDLLPTLVVDQEVRIGGREDLRWICQGPFAALARSKFPVVGTPSAESPAS